jgi:predicted  nucleic acid-binding Zn-ribbon protein
MGNKRGVSNISLELMKKQGVSLLTLAKEMVELEKEIKQQAAEINNLRDQIVALRETVSDARQIAENVNSRTAGLMVFGR